MYGGLDIDLDTRYDSELEEYVLDVDEFDQRPSVLVGAVLAELGAGPVDVHETIEPDALNRLFADRPGGDPRTEGYVVFPLNGYLVIFHADGTLRIAP